MIWLWDNAVTIANVVMAAAAIAALIYAHLQIAENKRAPSAAPTPTNCGARRCGSPSTIRSSPIRR